MVVSVTRSARSYDSAPGGAAAIPPTGGTTTPDPALGLDVVHGAPRPWAPGPVLSTSFGFGGHNGCLVLTPAP